MMKGIRFMVLAALLVAALTAGGYLVVKFYDIMLGIERDMTFKDAAGIGFKALMILVLGKLFLVSGKKKSGSVEEIAG
ncbi:MAG: hypothetical protein IKN14_05905 [Clostridiales bacterium]|nr:hypothetical protein [Clostridiales bacterium]